MFLTYCRFTYNAIIISSKCELDEHLNGNSSCLSPESDNIKILIFFDNSFRCENQTKEIYYKNKTRIYLVGREITIYDSPMLVVFRTSSEDSFLRQIFEILPIITHIIYGVKTCLLHGVGFEFDGKGFVGVGASGDGKTTLANLAFFEGLNVLSDEMIICDLNNNMIWGTPIISENYQGNAIIDTPLSIAGFFSLHKAMQWKLYQIENITFERLVNIFKDSYLGQLSINDIVYMKKQYKFFELYFNKIKFERSVFLT